MLPPASRVEKVRRLEERDALVANWYVSHHLRARACSAVDRQSTTNLFRTLAHANQSEMTGPSVARRLIVKTMPVISYAELHSPRIEYEINNDPLGLCMFHGVVHSLLSDAQQIVFNQSRQWPEGTIDFNLSVNSRLIR